MTIFKKSEFEILSFSSSTIRNVGVLLVETPLRDCYWSAGSLLDIVVQILSMVSDFVACFICPKKRSIVYVVLEKFMICLSF